MAKRNKIKSARPLLKLEALEQRQLLAGGFTAAQGTEYSNIEHENGNVYDQVLMKTSAISVSNDANQITRVSFLDLQGDIVQAEFSGAGTLSISLDSATGPAAPTLYAQSGVSYMSGLASFTIQGSDATTNFTLFTVGSATAHRGADNPIFAGGLTGGNNTADVARLTIVADPGNPNGSAFGGIRAGNAIFSNSSGVTGISAASVQVQDTVVVGNINATGSATPTLIVGANSQFGTVTVAGGSLLSGNAAALNNTGSYAYGITLDAGTNSAGVADAAKTASTQTFTGNNPLVAAQLTKTLSTGVDSLTGGSGADTFSAIASTFSAGDVLDGGAGTDTLSIVDNVAGMNTVAPAHTLTSIEKFIASSTGSIGLTASAAVTAVAAEKQVRTITPTVAVANAGNTLTVTYGSGSIVTAATDGTASASEVSVLVAAALNTLAGSTVAVASGDIVVVTSPTAGVALPTITAVVNVAAGDISWVQANLNAGVAAVVAKDAVSAAAYNLSGDSSLTDITVTAAGAINLTSSATANVSATTTSGKVTLSGGLSQIASGAGGFAISSGKGAITVTDTAQGDIASTVSGGTTVAITSTSKAAGLTTGTITVGTSSTSGPTGAVTVTSKISEGAGTTNTAGGTITVYGGTVDVIAQTAVKTLQTTAAANGTITSAAVAVNGTTNTTSVTVTASAPVTAVTTVVAAAAVTEVNTLTFAALAATETLIINGLTFTSTGVTTAAEAAAAFANLTSGATQGNSTKGNYSGTFTAGWTSGAVTGTSAVAFTGTTAESKANLADTNGTGADPTVVETVVGVTKATAAGKIGVTANTVTITDVNNGSTTKAGTITSVTASNYTTLAVNGNALTALSVTGGSGNITIANGGLTTATNKTLALTVDGLTGGTLDDVDIYTTLNVTTKYTGTSTTTTSTLANITDTALTALNVAGDKVLVLTSTAGATVLVDVAVTGSAGLTATFAAATMKTINTSGTTGTATITFDATAATYTGGAGVDKVTTSATAPTKAISLGGGDDTLVLHSGTTAVTGAISGGEGDDTLSMVAADAATADNDLAFSTLVTGFESLTLTGSTGSQTVLLSNLGLTNKVTVAAEAADGTTTLTDFANAGTLTLTGDRNGSGVTISNAAFATPTTDSVNVVMTATAGFDGGTVTAANVETVSLTATDSDSDTITTHTLIVTADKATTLNVTGNAGVALTLTGSVLLATLDASTATGVVTATSVSTAALTIKGGTGPDVLAAKASSTNADILIGNDGADTLTSNAGLTTLTGGAGLDTFVIPVVTANKNVFTTITDFTAGDRLELKAKGAETFTTTKLALGDVATFSDYLDLAAAGDGSTNGIIKWFQYGGNTYVVEDMTAAGVYTVATDVVVKLTGLIDLSTASLNPGGAPVLMI